MSLWKSIYKLLGYKTLRSMSFDDIVTVLRPRIDYHVRYHRRAGGLPGYDDDDIRQELLIELWKKLDRVPRDIVRPDYRFTRYIDTVFKRRIICLHRTMIHRGNTPKGRQARVYRDAISFSVPIEEAREV